MSAQRAHSPPATGSAVIRDVDVLKLLPPSVKGPGRRAARELLIWLKGNAGGRRFFTARNDTICDELGWSPATLKRAKGALRRAGMTIDELRDRGRGDYSGAARYVLDRRWIPALRPAVDAEQPRPEVRSKSTGSKEEKTFHLYSTASPSAVEVEVAPPRGSPTTAGAVVEPPAVKASGGSEWLPRAALVEAVPEIAEALAALRSGLPADVDELPPEELAEELRRLGRRLVAGTDGVCFDAFTVELVRQQLAAELTSPSGVKAARAGEAVARRAQRDEGGPDAA